MKNKFTSIFGILLFALALLSFSSNKATAQTYCNPSASPSYSYYGINTVVSGLGLANFSNTNTGVTTSGYANYTATDTVQQVQGGTFKIQASAVNYDINWAVWVDWNHDGDFTDAGEQVYMSAATATSMSVDITVPYSATATATRLRIIGSSPSISGPCMSNYGLEGEDYTVLIDAAPDCSGQPDAGNITGPATLHLCPNVGFTLTDTGATGAGSMTYQWQSRNPSGTGTWTDIAGASNFTLPVPAGITTSTDYRFYVVCNSSNMADTSNPVTVEMNSSNDCYCVIDFSGSSHSYYYGYAYLNSVQTTGGTININNANSGWNIQGYQDFRNSDTLRAMAGDLISLNPTVAGTSTFTSAGLMAWVDWNHDGDFTDAGENVSNVPSQQISNSYASTFTVPIIAQPGHTTMRIMVYPYESSFDPCGTTLPSYYWGEAEDYTVMIDSLPGCATATFPSSVNATIDHDTLCITGDVALDLDTAFYYSSVTYQWQSSPTATGSWSDIGTGQIGTSLSVTGVTANTWYRCEVKCNGTTQVTSNVVSTHISNPTMASAPTSGTRCGPGTVLLTAHPTAGNSANWYDQPSGGSPLVMGTNTYTTYYIPQTTVFYAAASGGTVSNNAFVGNANDILDYVYLGNPLGLYAYGANKQQFLITAAKMNSFGFNKAGYINSIGLDVLSAGNVDTMGLTIAIGQTTDADLTSGWHNVTQVYDNPTYTPTANAVNTYTFSTPFFWDGTSNIVIQFCNSIPGNTIPSSDWAIRGNSSDFSTYGISLYYYDYGVYTSICSTTSFYQNYYYPNIKFDIHELCEGPREADTAFVTPGPDFGITYDSVVCNNTIKSISVSTPLSNYSQGYTWTALDGNIVLYSDAAGATPYTGGNLSTVYFKSLVAGMHRVAVHASNGTAQSDCAAADTADIWVQPGNITILGMPDTICSGSASSTSMLQLKPNTGYSQGPYIQWQESADGITYNNIPSTNITTYTTVPLYTPHYYRAEISAVAGICESPDKLIVVANPVINSTTDSFNCGPGSVTLLAATGGNSGAAWYTSDTASIPIGFGSPFATPFQTQTDTYYVAARGGANSVPTEITLGAGASTSTTSNYPSYYLMPFSHIFGGIKGQYLIKKDELNAAGIMGGFITSVSFNMVDNSGNPTYNDFSVSVGSTSVASLSTTFETGLTEVRAPQDYTTTANAWNTISFDQPFYWDGSSNIVVQVCWSTNDGGSYPYGSLKYDDATFTASHVGYNDNQPASAICDGSGIPTFNYQTGNLRPQMKLGAFGPCESARQPVIASIYPKPAVDLGSDINECVDSGTTIVLNAGVQPYSPQFIWDNHTNSQIRSVNQSGTYYVSVTNSYTCETADTINIVLRDNPKVTLGNDTSVCVNTPVTLDAGSNGIQYFWNTGATTQTITVNTPGSYNVLVTNSQGCTVGDTITVNMNGQTPSFDGIMITNNGNHTFTFNALNPQNVIGYEWDFGDGSPHAFSAVPSHTYANDGTYIVTLISSSSCGSVSDSTSAHILGIGDVDFGNGSLSIYPNPTKDKATIVTKGAKMEKIAIFNVLGQKIYEADADSPNKHVIDLSSVASGVYNVTVYTDKGQVVRKLNVLK